MAVSAPTYGAGMDTAIAAGSLVEIRGIYDSAQIYDLATGDFSGSRVAVEGKIGRCVGQEEGDGLYIVQLFDSRAVLLERRHLREWTPARPESGGFDVFWPPDLPERDQRLEALGYLGYNIADTVSRQGWCLVQMTDDDLVRERACAEAKSLSYASLRKEFLPDYLGRSGDGKTCILQEGQRLRDAIDLPWALPELDMELTSVCKSLAPMTGQAFGFRCAGRRRGMVWMPFQDRVESDALRADPLTEEDVDAGVLDSHVRFLQRRRLCLMRWVHNTGGELELFPRPGSDSGAAPVTLPLSPGKLLVFRCDEFGFSYRPDSHEAVMLMTWVMDDESEVVRRVATGYFGSGDALQHSEALGIMVGPPMPTGHRMHIMAMHAHTPGAADTLESFNCMLTSGTDGFIHIPSTRFDTELWCTADGEKEPGLSYVRHGSMMSDQDITSFDNEFFGIRPDEVMTMTPNQRIILEGGYTCLRKAGFMRKTLNGRKMAAFLGDTGTDWDWSGQMKPLEEPLNAGRPVPFGNVEGSHLTFSGQSKIVSAGRLSYIMGLRGGSLNIDTACSASLVGISVATQAMRKATGGQVRPVADRHMADALCMGINLLTNPFPFVALCGPSMLAVKGRCFTFDVSAEGYARGDGFGAVYIMPGDSEDDYMKQLCCLMGTYTNQDGRSATLTAPNGMAQQACIKESMREAFVTASQITISECHGTGTALGDPIEVGALRGVMEPRETPMLTTSAKSNIGHTEACAGMIGVIKCVSMVASSVGHPNIHLGSMNPHLGVDGFPSYFESEAVETRLNSNYAGVSSFGFSGTNARADVWSQCKSGPRKAAEKLDLSKADQIHMRCPVSLGPIEVVSGEPATASFKKQKSYKADVLRDEWAPYDISTQAYEGGFRYRRTPKPETAELDADVSLVGSWSAWTRREEMHRHGPGHYVAEVVLGEGRYEMFRIVLNGDASMELYPVIKDGSQKIWIEGPDARADGRYWIIDGRDHEVPAGTKYHVHFRWHPEVKRISWEQVSSQPELVLRSWPDYAHKYCLTGSFAPGRFLDMKELNESTWEGTFRMGVAGEEEFQIARDRDKNQRIYPATPGAVRTTVPVRGPNSLGEGKFWTIRGMPNEEMTVRLSIVDAHVTVSVSSEIRGEKVWESEEGWDRHQYCALASWNGWVPVQMVMDPSEPGIFRAYGKVGQNFSTQHGAYVERFHIVVDEDSSHAFYPQISDAPALQYITEGPGPPADKHWLIRSRLPNARFELCLDLNQSDRRRCVSWIWVEAPALPNGSELPALPNGIHD